MQTSIEHRDGLNHRCIARVLALMICLAGPAARGQANSWTNPASGNWQAPSWSLGILPGAGQSIFITNAGWKAVMISPATVQAQPQSLSVDSIVIASPTNSFNTLLVNYAGFTQPLSARSLVIATNSALTMLSSALRITGPTGVGMSVGGDFNQGEFSVVSGGQIDIGYIGPGLYHLTNGILNMTNVFLGGAFRGRLIQNGGTNLGGIMHLDAGDYVLRGGEYLATTYFTSGGTFTQQGGFLRTGAAVHHGTYYLEDGTNFGGVVLPQSDGFSVSGNAQAVQTGGLMLGAIHLGGFAGIGGYVLSNGVVNASSISATPVGSFSQWGGTVTVAGPITLHGGPWDRSYARSMYRLSAGYLYCSGIDMDLALYDQESGTNIVAGDITIAPAGPVPNVLSLNGGLLMALNIVIGPEGNAFNPGGFFQNGGQCIVSNIVVGATGRFTQTGGVLNQSGVLNLIASRLTTGPGDQRFGRLQLTVSGGVTNSVLVLPAGSACRVHFGDSASLVWSNTAMLTISNWAGSIFGNGLHQVVFGTGPGALAPEQLAQIRFSNPACLPPGIYPSRIWPNGEIAPDPTVSAAGALVLVGGSDGAVQMNLLGRANGHYLIERSTNLIEWLPWTNRQAADGMISVTDADAMNVPRRFYRAVLLPP